MSAIKQIPFKALQIESGQFNGLMHSLASSIAINIAVDWLAWNQFVGISEDDFPINYDQSSVDWLTETVNICIELK